MAKVLLFAVGTFARLVSIIADLYGDWVLGKIPQGADYGFDWLRDLPLFGEWLVEVLADRWCGWQNSLRMG